MEGIIADARQVFCGKLDLSTDGVKFCSSSAIISPSSCINHAAVILMDVFLVLITLFISIWKGPSRGIYAQHRSALQWTSALLNACLGSLYVGLGIWLLVDELRKTRSVLPMHKWLEPLFHGIAWSVTSLIMSLLQRKLSKALKWTALAAAVVLSGLLSVSSIVEIMIERKPTLKTVIDILFLLGTLTLTLVTLRMPSRTDVEENGNLSLYEPLNEKTDDTVGDCNGSVSPLATAGIFSRLSFWWLNPLMKKGYQKILEDNDVPCLRDIDRTKTQYLLFVTELNKQKEVNKSNPPSIFWVIVCCHQKEICVSGLFALVKIVTLSASPVLLKTFINWAKKEDGSPIEGCVVALAFFFAKCLESLSQRQWYFRSRTLGVQIRSLLSAAIYSKQLRLSNSAKTFYSSGELMNYVAVDAYRVGEFPFWLHQTWTTLLQICLALVILFNVVGLATISALVAVILTVLCNLPLAKLQHTFQSKLMEAQDARLKSMTEALMNMKVLKLYAWETNFKTVIEGLRQVELKWLSACQTRKAYLSFVFWASPVFVSAATFGTCYLLGISLNASNVFTFIATMRILQDPIRTFPDVIGVVIQAKVAFSRIVKFLDAPELQNLHVRNKHMSETEYPIVIKSASFSWEEYPIKSTLSNINLEVKRKDKVAICGEVGSGKSSILAAILGEIPNTNGLIQVNGRIAYVSQAAWIPRGTIQDNILFGSSMNKQRYQETLERCSLVKDLDMLPFGDLTEIGERGVNLSGGQKQRLQLARALYQDADIYLLDDPFSAVDAHTATSLFNDYVMGALAEKTVLLVTHQVDFLPAFDYVLLMSDGEVLQGAPYDELMSSSAKFWDLVHAHKEVLGSKEPDNQVNVKREKDPHGEITHIYPKNNNKNVKGSSGDQLIKNEEKEKGDTGLRPYLQYLNQNRGYLYFALAVISHIMFLAGQILQNSWMAANVENPQFSQFWLITVYLVLGFTTTILLLCRSVFSVVLGLQSSKSLFSQLLNSLYRAPISFFDSTPVGRILSRVSSDMTIVDLDLPFTLVFSASATLNVYCNLGVLATITWQVLLVSIPMVYLSIKLQKYYYAAGKELMRINGTTKSAVANHISESILGAITIRAFREEERFFSKTLELVDKNASPFLHTFAASEWLMLRLEVMSAIILSSAAMSMALLPRGTFSAGLIGMALSYGLSLNSSLVASIRNQCTLANYIISVERLNQFMHIPSEAPEIIEGNRTAPEWPTLGKVEIQDLKIRYKPESPLVIQGLSCTFGGGQKIGIVGRTGSGKTTLIGALFRLVEPAGGKILVDGVDIETIGLHDLRSRLAIIPQEPTLFYGTVRYNLDPLGQYTDEEIWEVLDKCQLCEAIRNKNEKGLYSPVMEDGSNWSIGQRQLFCLGRALLKRSRVLVLDEATASIDNATDSIIQKTIRAEFADSTVITVAHRIPTVMDCSMVLAISYGKLVEFDKPEKLMQTVGSLFAKLVKEYWSHALDIFKGHSSFNLVFEKKLAEAQRYIGISLQNGVGLLLTTKPQRLQLQVLPWVKVATQLWINMWLHVFDRDAVSFAVLNYADDPVEVPCVSVSLVNYLMSKKSKDYPNQGRMEGFNTDARYIFCGKLNCLSDGPKHCNFGEIISSTSCINHAAVISMDAFLLLMSLLISIWKGQSREIYTPFFSRYCSPLKLTSVLLNACLGSLYVGLGIWLLVDELRKTRSVLPLHKWLEPLFHGIAWSVMSLIMSLRQRKLSKALKWTTLAAAVVLSGLLSVSSIVGIMIERKLTLKTVIDILCLPGGLILILVTLKMSNHVDIEENGDSSLYEPLNETTNDIVGDCCSSFSPFAAAGSVSRLSFWWLNPLMKRGYQKILEDNDVPSLREIDQSKTRYLLFMEEFNKQKKAKNSTPPSIFWVIVHCHWKEICVSGLFAFVKIMTLSAGPMLLKTFIKLAKKEDGSWVEGCAVALTFFLAKCLESLSQRQWYFRSRIVGVQVRSLLSAVIYSKQLRLSNSAKILHSSGELMSYITVDAYRVGEFPFWLHQTWTTLLQICMALMILFNVVGLATISALVVVTLTVLCNLPLAKLQHKFQSKLMEAEDARLKAMTEALMNMKVLKLYAWETNFKLVIEGLRKVELKWLSGCQTRRAYNSFLFWASPVFVSAATFGTCYLIGIPLNASNVFTFIATMRILQDPIRTFPDVIGVVIQAKVAFSRIVKFLDAPELQNLHVRNKHMSETEYLIVIKSASFSWEEYPIKSTLRNINLEVKRKDKVAICGEVGSGKSSLLAAILGEIPNTEGLIQVNGKIAYVSQTAWIPQGTIQDNILFGSPMDKQRYKDTLERCSLVKDLDMLPFGDLTEIGERGVNLSGGQKQRLQLARALYQDADIYLLDDPFSAVDAHTATSLFNDYVMGALADKTVLLVTHQVDFLPAFDYVLLLSHGEILQNAPYYELMSLSAEFQNLVNAHKEVVGSKKPDNQLNVKKGKDSEEEIKHICAKTTSKSVKGRIGDQLIKKEEKETGDTGLKPYLQYLNQNWGYLYFSLALVSHIMFIAGQILQNSWMAANVENPQFSQLQLISVYLAIGFTTTIFLFCRSVFSVVLGLQSSKSLFSQLLDSLFRAPMSFFDSTPVGRILSRVSTDMSIVDLDIPFTLIISASAALNVYSNLGVLATITWQVLLVSLPMVYLTIRLQKYYYAAGKELMRINGTTKSAVANHISESMLGAVTIRAFQEEERFFSKTLELVDRNASPFLHTFAASEWLLLRLEVMGAIVLSSTALSMALLPRGTFSSGLIGMGLSYGLSLNNSLVASVRNQCTLANYIISVERLNQFVHIPSEAPEIIEGKRTAPEWPSSGKVEIQDLKIRYRPESPLVIQGLTCTFEGGQKIGVVGRTGSGKTTLISALFRLVEPAGGKILVDGVDIGTIGLHDLRSRFAIIPQDPTLFSGTVRYNLDPLGQYADEEIWAVLSKCQLLEAVQNKNEKGLYSPVMEDGSNWSIGQRQLFCLCRALLKRSQVLVLDEATASIDNATDLIIQKTVRAEFADSTVITVAHRIPTVMDCSSVLTISDGKLVEFDKPEKLMQTDGSLFAKLVKEYWSHALNASSYSSN